MEKIELTDAKQMAIDHPDTFQRASEAELSELKPTDFVKVCANPERFWIQITEVSGVLLKGRVDNDLISTDKHGYEYEDEVIIHIDHVYNIKTLQEK